MKITYENAKDNKDESFMNYDMPTELLANHMEILFKEAAEGDSTSYEALFHLAKISDDEKFIELFLKSSNRLDKYSAGCLADRLAEIQGTTNIYQEVVALIYKEELEPDGGWDDYGYFHVVLLIMSVYGQLFENNFFLMKYHSDREIIDYIDNYHKLENSKIKKDLDNAIADLAAKEKEVKVNEEEIYDKKDKVRDLTRLWKEERS